MTARSCRVSVRRPYHDATYDVSTGYGLTIFKICKSADYYKIVEATEIEIQREREREREREISLVSYHDVAMLCMYTI